MNAIRFSFEALGASVYRPQAGRTDRLSLAWWPDDHGDGRPVFTGAAERPTTLVIAWPTNIHGHILPHNIDDAPLLNWAMPRGVFAALAALHPEFPLSGHDVRVTGGAQWRIDPCTESILERLPPDQRPAWVRRIRERVAQLERAYAGPVRG